MTPEQLKAAAEAYASMRHRAGSASHRICEKAFFGGHLLAQAEIEALSQKHDIACHRVLRVCKERDQFSSQFHASERENESLRAQLTAAIEGLNSIAGVKEEVSERFIGMSEERISRETILQIEKLKENCL